MGRTAGQDQTSIHTQIRQRIEREGERIWRYTDFRSFSASAVAQSLCRLARSGTLRRVSKGVYFRPRQTAFGESRPNPADIAKLSAGSLKLFPAGLLAANHLGFSTQNPSRRELATTAWNTPRAMKGSDMIVHVRRPPDWDRLTESEGALLDFLRRRAEGSELSPIATRDRILLLLTENDRFEHLFDVAATEPARVRALLGALGEEMGKPTEMLRLLKNSLNPLSRFDYGVLSLLTHANNWQAKERTGHETVSTS